MIMERETQGYFDHVLWAIQLGTDEDSTQQMASAHELTHSQINSNTVYGILLKFYSFLSKDSEVKNEHYKEIIYLLHENSKWAHEVFATWFGVYVIQRKNKNLSPEHLLNHNLEYIAYYKTASNLLYGIPGQFIPEAAIECIINFCFQSKIIGETALNNFTKFSMPGPGDFETPDNRLKYITENLVHPYFSDIIARFFETKKDAEEYPFLVNEVNGKSYLNRISGYLGEKSEQELRTELMSFIYQHLQEHFDGLHSFSYNINEQLLVAEKLFNLIEKLHPESSFSKFFRINPDPFNAAKSVFLKFEGERIKLAPPYPLKCIIQLPSMIEQERKAELFAIMEENSVILHTRHSSFLVGEYQFINAGDKEWMNTVNQGLTFIRVMSGINKEQIIVLIPFRDQMELYIFFSTYNWSKGRIGYISNSVMMDAGWRSTGWLDFFQYGVDACYWLNDISLLYTLEKVNDSSDPNNGMKFIYGGVSVTEGGLNLMALLLCVTEGDNVKIIIMPCSYGNYKQITAYIDNNYQAFSEDNFYFHDHITNVKLIMSSIISEENMWTLSNGYVIDQL